MTTIQRCAESQPVTKGVSVRSRSVIEVIDTHAAGAAGRVVVNAFLGIHGKTMLEKMTACRESLEGLRKLLLQEPRGYPGLCCNIVVPPVRDDSDFGYLCLEQGGITAMSGSNTMCVVTALVETGMLSAREGTNTYMIDTPAGQVRAVATVVRGDVIRIDVNNVPSFVLQKGVYVAVDGIGEITVDIAFGGQFYILASSASLGVQVELDQSRGLADIGGRVLAAAQEQLDIAHPESPAINEITWTLIYDDQAPLNAARACAVGPAGRWAGRESPVRSTVGVLDRSPCGTGTSARIALLSEQGRLAVGERIVQESILGGKFIGTLTGVGAVGNYAAVETTISGRAFITGFAQVIVDEEDPYPNGFVVGDIWNVPDDKLPSE